MKNLSEIRHAKVTVLDDRSTYLGFEAGELYDYRDVEDYQGYVYRDDHSYSVDKIRQGAFGLITEENYYNLRFYLALGYVSLNDLHVGNILTRSAEGRQSQSSKKCGTFRVMKIDRQMNNIVLENLDTEEELDLIYLSKYWLKLEQESDYIKNVSRETIEKESDDKTITDHSWYTQLEYEPISIIKGNLSKDEYRGFLQGNIQKYMSRHKHREGIQDLKEAYTYLGWLIDDWKERGE